jgi:glycosyltransferase involved in cell wall biosynthesis
MRDDIPDILGATDVWVLASLWEGNPLAVMEAMAASKPVIATSVGGVPELIRNEETGLLVPPNEVAALAEAMVRLGSSFELRRRLGDAAGRVAASTFDVSTMVSSYERLYEEMLSRSFPR